MEPAIFNDWGQIIVGALLGAGLTYATTLVIDRRKAQETHRERLRNLLVEMQQNALISTNVMLAGGKAKARLADSMWDIAKGEIIGTPSALQKALLETYAEIFRLNNLVAYDLHKAAMGSGAFDQAIEHTSQTVKALLEDSVRGLEAYLGRSLHDDTEKSDSRRATQ
jgi:hypothetical protein